MAGGGAGQTHARLGYACDLILAVIGNRIKYINVVTPGVTSTWRVNPLQCTLEVRRVWVAFNGEKAKMENLTLFIGRRKHQCRQNELTPRCRRRGPDRLSGRCQCAGCLRFDDRAAYLVGHTAFDESFLDAFYSKRSTRGEAVLL